MSGPEPSGADPSCVRATGRHSHHSPGRNAEPGRLRRRYLLLSATRWLPTGLLIPVMIVLMTERGLSLATVGIISAIGAAVVLVLELPTGGLADVLGRRPVLLVASLFNLAATLVMAFAGNVWLFVLVWALEGVYRALESGPLDAWYVDEAQAADPDADIEAGLAASGLVLSFAIGAGALLGGALALVPVAGLPALALPALVASTLRLVDIAALWILLDERTGHGRAGIHASPTLDGPGSTARDRPGTDVSTTDQSDSSARRGGPRMRARVAARRAVVDTGRTVREALGLLRGSAALVALALVELLWGAGMWAVEVLSGPRLADLLGDPQGGVFALSLAAAVAWSISGLGSAAAPRLARVTGSWVRAAILTRVIQGVGVLAAAVVAGPVGLLIGYLGFYLVHGSANVAHYGLMHRHVGPAHRTTMHSVNSLTSRLGAIAAAPPLGALATGAGMPAAFAVSALLLALPAPLYLLARSRPAPTPMPTASIPVVSGRRT